MRESAGTTGRMAVLCLAGMAAGLCFDAAAGRLATFVALCSSGPHGLWYSMRLHWHLLPGMHLGMLLAGAWPLRSCMRRGRAALPGVLSWLGLCYPLMLAGMSAGALAMHRLGPAVAVRPLLVPAMALGMVAGLALGGWVALLAHGPRLREAAA